MMVYLDDILISRQTRELAVLHQLGKARLRLQEKRVGAVLSHRFANESERPIGFAS